MKIILPRVSKNIIETFYKNGYEAFVVGGCVRDSLLGNTPNDWDICTNAKPMETLKLFKNKFTVVETGLKHGTISLVDESKEVFEVTTYRIDGEYKDNRRPENVEFTNHLKDDLSRRDFTINAMAYNDKDGIIDYFGGIDDLNNKIIRCVGKANERFNEDALRILRAYRFLSKLDGFNLHKDILDTSKKLAYLLTNISVERIREEFSGILINNVKVLDLLIAQGIMEYIVPEIVETKLCTQNNPHHILNVFDHTIEALENTPRNLILRLAVFFHDIGKPISKTTDNKGIDHFYCHALKSTDIAKRVLKRLKYDNKTIEKVLLLIKNHNCDLSSNKSIKRLLNKIGEDNFRNLLEVKKADIYGQNPKYICEKIENLNNIEMKFNNIIIENQCFKIKDLSINGSDLIKIGIKPGKEIGIILDTLLDRVIEDESLNTKENLVRLSKEFREKK